MFISYDTIIEARRDNDLYWEDEKKREFRPFTDSEVVLWICASHDSVIGVKGGYRAFQTVADREL